MTFFHGTNADLSIGDLLLPGALLHVTANHGRSEHVYMTSDSLVDYDYAVKEAYAWARTACMVAEDEGTDEEPEAYVYIVEPLEAVEADGGEDVGDEAFRTGTARIIGVVDAYDLLQHHTGHGNSYIY